MAEKKDNWDKTEIIGKALVPVLVVLATLVINGQVGKRQVSAEMIQIAVGVLSKEADADNPDPLRKWAVAVLAEPLGKHQLDPAARQALISGTSTLSMLKFGTGAAYLGQAGEIVLQPKFIIPNQPQNGVIMPDESINPR